MSKDIKKIYMIGICGIAMGTLAGMLKQRGFTVSGSDENMYPPMSDMLREWGIDLHTGFDHQNIGNPDLVIIGNAISRGNIEAEYVLNRKIPYLSMAQSLYNFFLKNKEVISISGTHGKTTTTALLAHILEVAGEKPSFLVGGVLRNYNTNFKLGDGKYFVIEGDEYDSAFFEKIPKFILYRPHHLILTSLEFDHADIYNDLDEIKLWFKRLVNTIPSNGNIVLASDYPHLKEVTAKAYSDCYSFGNSKSDFRYKFLNFSEHTSKLEINSQKFEKIELISQMFGNFNYANITAAVSMALLLGINENDIRQAVGSFEGVKRRQELIYNCKPIKIYEDFAHHPTEIRSVLSEMKKRYPDYPLWAIYEPRSATSRRNILQDELCDSFNSADKIIIKNPYKLNSIPEPDRINISNVLQDITKKGKEAHLFNTADEIIDYVFRKIDLDSNNIITIMSNGGFDGIYEKIIKKAKKVQKNPQ